MTKAIFIIGIFFSSIISIYASITAEVVVMKGHATKLLPRSQAATSVSLGDKLIEDTSILTTEKSFLRLKFSDGSTLNLGPNSKIVIAELNQSDVNVISLLKGQVRTKVIKDSDGVRDNKFFIKTRSAALGVRGTEFQTIYNPDNKLTSLLTFDGEVAMAKIDERTHERLEDLDKSDDLTISRDENNKPKIEKVENKDSRQINQLEKILNKNEAVSVLPGQYAQASDVLPNSTIPVKINPIQFEILKKNTELQVKEANNGRPADLSGKADPETLKQMVDSTANPEGFYDAKKGLFAPKAGGVIDLETGFYIAPDSSAKFDEKNKVYLAQNTGTVDRETGQYLPPLGLKLDAKQGFVSTENSPTPNMLVLKDDLNRDSLDKNKFLKPTLTAFDINSKFLRDELELALFMGGTRINLKYESNGYSSQYDSKDHQEVGIKWRMGSTKRIRPSLGLNYKNIVHHTHSNFSQNSNSAFDISVGLDYALTKNFNIISIFGINQNYFAKISDSNSNSFALVRMGVTEFGLGIDGDYAFGEKWKVYGKFLPKYSFKRDLGMVGANANIGFTIEVMPQYKLFEKNTLGLGFKTTQNNKTITASNAKTKNDMSESGIQFVYNREL